MNKTIAQRFISTDRFDRYLQASNGDLTLAFEFYNCQMLLSGCFYPLLSIVEVALRNRLHETLGSHFADPDWILTQKTGFMAHPSFGKNQQTKRQVESAETMIRKKGKSVRHQIVTELTLAFWTRLFQADHFGLLKAAPMKIFDHLPRNTKRETAHGILKQLLDFRNRVYHNEPACFGIDRRTNRTFIDLTSVQATYDNLYTVFFWLGGNDLTDWVQNKIDQNSVFAQARKMNGLIAAIGIGKPFVFVKN